MTNIGSETISALKTSPLLLVVILLNAGMLWALLHVASTQREERQDLTKMLIDCRGKIP
jgi:hypothetical protein